MGSLEPDGLDLEDLHGSLVLVDPYYQKQAKPPRPSNPP